MVDKAKEYGVPIRVGVNSGSLEKPLIEKYGGVTAEGHCGERPGKGSHDRADGL